MEVPDLLTFMQRATGEASLAPPHRLDRETSGAQLLTRDREAAQRFFTLFKTHLVGKTYLALVHGTPTGSAARWTARWATWAWAARTVSPCGRRSCRTGNRP